MNNQRTLEIIREDLTSSNMVDTEGTFWDNRHPHLFVVMGASVSLCEFKSLIVQLTLCGFNLRAISLRRKSTQLYGGFIAMVFSHQRPLSSAMLAPSSPSRSSANAAINTWKWRMTNASDTSNFGRLITMLREVTRSVAISSFWIKSYQSLITSRVPIACST